MILFSPFSFRLRRYAKHSRQCLTTSLKTPRFAHHIFNSFFGVQKCDQTNCFAFDILLKCGLFLQMTGLNFDQLEVRMIDVDI